MKDIFKNFDNYFRKSNNSSLPPSFLSALQISFIILKFFPQLIKFLLELNYFTLLNAMKIVIILKNIYFLSFHSFFQKKKVKFSQKKGEGERQVRNY